MITINVKADVRIEDAQSGEVLRQVHAIAQQLENLMNLNEENKALLDQINVYTNQMATSAAADSAKITEIGGDIDDLLANLTDTTVRDRLAAHVASLAAIAANEQARTETLTNIAAKHDKPLPPPVEPPAESASRRRR